MGRIKPKDLKYEEVEITNPENTKYFFVCDESNVTKWYVYCLSHENDKTFSHAFNNGEFTPEDYADSEEVYFWDWYKISRNERLYMRYFVRTHNDNKPMSVQEMREMKKHLFAHTEPTMTVSQAAYMAASQYHAQEEKPMRDDMYPVKATASTINIAPAASASVTQKTDLQNQREYLQGRLSEVRSSFRYGTLHNKMRDAFAIDINNTPKTAKELIDGIKSGKFTLDEDKMAVQDVVIGTGDEIYDRDQDVYVYPSDPLYAMNWGGLSPDRVGYEKAKASFEDGMKAAADTIMIGDPTSALAAIQALEAWTPPAAAAAN